MPIILGVDPGYSQDSPGALAWMADSPLTILDNTKWANHHEPYKALRDLLKTVGLIPELIVIEKQHARATRDKHGKVVQGIASTWNYAEHYGILLGCLAVYDKHIIRPEPSVWKAHMHLDRDKTKSLEMAQKLWPLSYSDFKLKKHHGRAEAALLAKYGERFIVPPLTPPLSPPKRRVL